jgi:altronate hydrolase
MTPSPVIRLHTNDDVLIATQQLMPGMLIEPENLTVRELIPPGHKVAARDIQAGDAVRRYNQIIGFATTDIGSGRHVHTHNLSMGEFERDYGIGQDVRTLTPVTKSATFMGYKRPNGKVGTRNYIAVIASVNCSATVVRAIANHFNPQRLESYSNVDGVIALPHPLGCGLGATGEGMDILRRTLVGYAKHPNFAGVLFVGLGCEQNQIAPLLTLVGAHEPGMLQQLIMQAEGGTTAAIKKGITQVTAMLEQASFCKREEVSDQPLDCRPQLRRFRRLFRNHRQSGSRWRVRSAGQLMAATTVLSETPGNLRRRTPADPPCGQPGNRPEADRSHHAGGKNTPARSGGQMDNNPSVGNKAGGFTTILEKSLGAVAKGGTSTLNGVYLSVRRTRLTAKRLRLHGHPRLRPRIGDRAGGWWRTDHLLYHWSRLGLLMEQSVIPVFYHPDEEVCINVIQACANGGAKCVEFTNRGDFAASVFLNVTGTLPRPTRA